MRSRFCFRLRQSKNSTNRIAKKAKLLPATTMATRSFDDPLELLSSTLEEPVVDALEVEIVELPDTGSNDEEDIAVEAEDSDVDEGTLRTDVALVTPEGF